MLKAVWDEPLLTSSNKEPNEPLPSAEMTEEKGQNTTFPLNNAEEGHRTTETDNQIEPMVNEELEKSFVSDETVEAELDYEEDIEIERNRRDISSIGHYEQVTVTQANKLVNKVYLAD